MLSSLTFGTKTLDLKHPLIMGILNTTPDSFSDGGRFNQIKTALQQIEQLVAAGADIIDIGGESTRPGAKKVSTEEELERVIPLIEQVSSTIDVVISIDTYKAKVMQEAVAAGARLINDVRALQDHNALEVAAKLQVPVCLMHMQGEPKTMQQQPCYHEITNEVISFLLSRVQAAKKAGIKEEHIILDPGFGFGKSLDHNYELLAQLKKLTTLHYPILAGLSRKSMLGGLLKLEVNERELASVLAGFFAVQQGVAILRVHDVAATKQMVMLFNKIREYSS